MYVAFSFVSVLMYKEHIHTDLRIQRKKKEHSLILEVIGPLPEKHMLCLNSPVNNQSLFLPWKQFFFFGHNITFFCATICPILVFTVFSKP